MKAWQGQWGLITFFSVGLVGASWLELVPLNLTEVFGFITGVIGVWLTVKQNIWNWPIGLANNLFYLVIFFQARLYADMSLQIVYIVLEILGWYWWLRGGENRTQLKVGRTSRLTWLVLGVLLVISTLVMTLVLDSVQDAAPFWDALTTCLSLEAQYLLTRKLLENWYVWISADLIYVGLYIAKGLYLTSLLYFLFLCLCYFGLRDWRQDLAAQAKIGSSQRDSETELSTFR